jgi:O-antigen/teichoic acid export membrane protein
MASSSAACRSIARNTRYLVTGEIVGRAIRALYLILLARLLGPDLFGLLSYAQFWQLLFFALVVFGTGRVLSREIGRDPAGFPEVLASALTLRVLIGLIVASIAAFVGWWLAPDAAARQLAVIFSLALVARGIASFAQQIFIASEASHLTLRQEAVWRSTEALLGLTVLAVGGGLVGIAGAHLLSWVLQAGSGLMLVRRDLHPLFLGWYRQRVRTLLQDGLSAMLVASALSVILNGTLVLYLNLFPDRTDAGQLAAVLQALMLLLLLPKALATSTLPILGRQVAAGDGDDGRTIAMLLRLTLLASAVIALLGMSLTSRITELVLGAGYANAGTWLGPSLWLLLPFGIGQLLSQHLFAHGQIWPNAIRAWAGAMGTLLTLWPLGHWMGGAGVLVAVGIGLQCWAMALARHTLRHGLLKLDPGLLWAVSLASASAVIATGMSMSNLI